MEKTNMKLFKKTRSRARNRVKAWATRWLIELIDVNEVGAALAELIEYDRRIERAIRRAVDDLLPGPDEYVTARDLEHELEGLARADEVKDLDSEMEDRIDDINRLATELDEANAQIAQLRSEVEAMRGGGAAPEEPKPTNVARLIIWRFSQNGCLQIDGLWEGESKAHIFELMPELHNQLTGRSYSWELFQTLPRAYGDDELVPGTMVKTDHFIDPPEAFIKRAALIKATIRQPTVLGIDEIGAH